MDPSIRLADQVPFPIAKLAASGDRG